MAEDLSWGLVLLLAMVQGITEFLPISSSAHLLLPSLLFDLPDQGLMFDTSVHGGTLVAVMLYFRGELSRMAQSLFNPRLKEDRHFAIWLLLASIPVLASGFFLVDLIETHLRNLWVVSWTTLLFALLLWWAARRGGSRTNYSSPRILLLVGCAQVMALVPGVSRAGITITAGLWQGLAPQAAARLAFLFSIPVIGAAFVFGIYRLVQVGEVERLTEAAVAFFVAALFSYLTISFFLRLVNHLGIMPFVIYRLLLGVVLLLFLWYGY